jgi:hypothetical protein
MLLSCKGKGSKYGSMVPNVHEEKEKKPSGGELFPKAFAHYSSCTFGINHTTIIIGVECRFFHLSKNVIFSKIFTAGPC